MPSCDQQIACNSTEKQEAECASLSVLFLVRALVADQPAAREVIDLYNGAVRDFATRKASRVRPAMIRQLCQRQPDLASALLPTLASATSEAVNNFRRCQVMDLIRTLLQQKKSETLTRAIDDNTSLILQHVAASFETMHEAGQGTKVSLMHGV